jgi:tetratricopeptide (TPR) repeat protein
MTESAAASADAARQRRADSLRPDASLRRVEQRPALICCSPEAGAELFERVDMNGNGGLSLVEIDQAIVDGTIGAALGDSDTLTQPDFAKPVIMRACKAAEVSHDGFIQRAEFMKLLAYLVYFHATYEAFDEIGTDHDRRLTLAEFSSGCARIGLELSSAEAAAEFSRIDTDAGGFVLFGEFCKWAARRHCDSAPVEEQQEAKGASAHPSISADGEDSVHTAQTEETLEHAAGNADIELSAAEQEEIRHKIYSTLLRQAGLNDGDGQPAVSDDPSTKSKAEMLEAHIDLAEACRVQRSWSAAAEAYEEALVIAQSADVALAPEDIAELHNRRGMVLHQFGDDEGAVAAYTAGIAAAAASPRATLYCHRGLSCSRIGQLAAAEKDLRRAVELGGATPDERAVAELAEVSRARRAGVNPASTPTGTAASPNGGSSSNRYSKRRSPTIELPHGITPPAKGSPDSSTAMPASARPSSYGSASKVSPRIRTRVSAQEARTKAQICAATGQSVMPAARGVRLLQEISSIASSFDDVELKALAKAALSEREEATGKWRRELARLRQQSKRQREEIDELKKSKEASVAEAAEAKRQRDERVEAVRSNSEKLLREGRAKQHAAARKRIAEANLNHSAILATALASFRQLVTDVTQEFANATDGSDEYSAAGAGIAMRDELLSRFDLLAAGVEGAVSEQQASLALSPGQATSPGVRESGAPKSSNGSSGAGSVSPVARGDRKDGGSGSAATAVARAKVWHNDSIIGGSQTGLGIYSSDKKLGRPSPSTA